jgi:hypothetical protein
MSTAAPAVPATTLQTVAPDWLALRAAADDDARSLELAAELGEMFPGGAAVVHDLGAGDGAMVRWLAPRLPGPQAWVLHDADAGILSRANLTAVADRSGGPVDVETRIAPLAELPAHAFVGATAVTASALLDVLTRAEAERIVAECVAAATPALFSLTVTGRVRLHPTDPADAVIAAAFDAHPRRPAPGRDAAGALLGPDAVPVVAGLFAAAGWAVRTDPTPWRLGATDRDLIVAWLDGWVGAAVEQHPALAGVAAPYRTRRVAEAEAGTLRVTVSHEDVLAWPR